MAITRYFRQPLYFPSKELGTWYIQTLSLFDCQRNWLLLWEDELINLGYNTKLTLAGYPRTHPQAAISGQSNGCSQRYSPCDTFVLHRHSTRYNDSVHQWSGSDGSHRISRWRIRRPIMSCIYPVFAGPVEVCINYSDLLVENESMLRLFHYEDPAWLDITSSLDTTNDTICGLTSSFSPFAIFEPDNPTTYSFCWWPLHCQ